MTLYMPPLETKKRGGLQKPDPDTKRVFGNYDENLPAAQSHYSTAHSNLLAGRKFSPAKSRVWSPARQHNPHPSQVGFLLQDCRLMHEPICDVKPQSQAVSADPESSKWWKWQAGSDEAVKRTPPKYSYHSTNRDEFRKPEKPQPGQTRHISNPGTHVSGIVPVTSLPSEKGPRLLVEHISYDHQYNSRTNPSQPIRGKKHGSFVWDCFHPVSPSKLAISGNRKTTVLKAPWASTTQEPSPSQPSLETGSIKSQEVVGLGTLDSTVPQLTELPPIGS